MAALEQSWSTEHLQPGKALSYWRDVICENLLQMHTGTTFCEELYACRLHRAQRLLCDRRFDGLGIAEIAWNCGFSEPSHFTRRFRERFGSAPSAFRRNSAN